MHHCDVCGQDAEEDRVLATGCGDPRCCSPSYWLPCGCPMASICCSDEDGCCEGKLRAARAATLA